MSSPEKLLLRVAVPLGKLPKPAAMSVFLRLLPPHLAFAAAPAVPPPAPPITPNLAALVDEETESGLSSPPLPLISRLMVGDCE